MREQSPKHINLPPPLSPKDLPLPWGGRNDSLPCHFSPELLLPLVMAEMEFSISVSEPPAHVCRVRIPHPRSLLLMPHSYSLEADQRGSMPRTSVRGWAFVPSYQ